MRTPKSASLLGMALAMMLAAASCLPIAHTETLAPSFEGQYRDPAGQPVQGAVMVVSTARNDTLCTRPSATASTDAAGNYTLPAIRKRESYTILLPVDYEYCYSVCGGRSGAPLKPADSGCRLGSLAKKMTLDCAERADAATGAISLQCAASSRRQRAIAE